MSSVRPGGMTASFTFGSGILTFQQKLAYAIAHVSMKLGRVESGDAGRSAKIVSPSELTHKPAPYRLQRHLWHETKCQIQSQVVIS